MKKLLIIFFLPLLVFSCKNSENSSNETAETLEMERTNWANEHLNGKVKSIEETPYTPDDSGKTSEMDSCCVDIKEFNEQGFVMKRIEKDNTGNITQLRVMERTETGLYLSSTATESGKEVWKRQVKRDDDGNVLYVFDTDSTQQTTFVYSGITYNEFNQPVQGKMHAADSTYRGTWSWQYIDGEMVGRGWVDSAGVELVKRVGEVNDKGWVSKVVDVRVDEEGEKTTSVETYTYDSFDDKGNWTMRTEMNDDKPVKVLKRIYSYF